MSEITIPRCTTSIAIPAALTKAGEMERKTVPFEVKGMGDEGNGWIEGIGNRKGLIDSYGDVTVDGCFTPDIAEFRSDGFMSAGHNWDFKPTAVIGWIDDTSRETDEGLYVKMHFHSNEDAQKVRSMVQERMAAGKGVFLSIGYFTLEAETGEKDGQDVRYLKRLLVKEVSLVTVPANGGSSVARVKSGAGSRLDDQVAGALGDLRDLKTRLVTLHADRKQGLSDARLAELKEVAEELGGLIEEVEASKAPEPPEEDPIADIELDMLNRELEASGLI